MSFALIPIMRLLPTAMEATTRLERITMAEYLAQDKMEEVRSQIHGTSPDYGFDKDYTLTDGPEAFPVPNEGYKFWVGDSTEPSFFKFLAVIVWFDTNNNNLPDPDEKSVILETIVANRV